MDCQDNTFLLSHKILLRLSLNLLCVSMPTTTFPDFYPHRSFVGFGVLHCLGNRVGWVRKGSLDHRP